MTWRTVAGSLQASGRHVVAPDLPGHGSAARTPFTWEAAVALVRETCESISDRAPILVGLSLGAAVALRTAREHQGLPGGLVLTGAGACWSDRVVRASLLAAGVAGAALAAVGRNEFFAYAAGHRGSNIARVTRELPAGSPLDLLRSAVALERFDARAWPLPSAPRAVMVLTEDRRMPPGLQRGLARHLRCPQVDVAADHDAPVSATTAFVSGLEAALRTIEEQT